MKQLLDRAKNAPAEVRQEAVWAVANAATKGTEFQIMTVVQFGGIEALVDAINLGKLDCKLLQGILSALRCILNVGEKYRKDYSIVLEELGGNDAIESLQEHPIDDVQKMAVYILENFFDTSNTDEVENVLPATTSDGQYAFGLTSKQLFSSVGESEALPVLENSMLNTKY